MIPAIQKETKKTLTQKRLKELLIYNSETGVFTRKISVGRHGCHKIGTTVGTIRPDGYLTIMVDKRPYLAQRLAFLWMEGYLPENLVDHIDRIKNNNKWANLREVSTSCNARNSKIRATNKSGITGISWSKKAGKWLTHINVPKKQLYLGYHSTLKSAAQARWEAEVKYGFPGCKTTSPAYQYLKSNAHL